MRRLTVLVVLAAGCGLPFVGLLPADAGGVDDAGAPDSGSADAGEPDAGCVCDGACRDAGVCCDDSDCAQASSCFDTPVCSGARCTVSASPRGAPCTADTNLCTDDVCNGAGTCVHLANDAGCNDGLACTANDRCLNSACAGTSACTVTECEQVSACLADGGCMRTFRAVGSACTADALACTADVCNSAGACVHPQLDAGSACTSDNNPCSSDVCAVDGGCQHLANTLSCNDGNACTVNDRCSTFACVGMARNCDDGNACTTDSCSAADGGCLHAPRNSGSCNDNKSCTSNDTCTNGVCVGIDGCPAGSTCVASQCQCNAGGELYCSSSGVCRDPVTTCKDLGCGFCGTSALCDGVTVAYYEGSIAWMIDCQSTLPACNAASASSQHYHQGEDFVCLKYDGAYQWRLIASSVAQGGIGCTGGGGRRCDYYCTPTLGYAVWCHPNGNWQFDFGADALNDGGCNDGSAYRDLAPLPAGYACP